MAGPREMVLPGNAAVVDQTKPFSQLSNFGNTFLTRFECSVVQSQVLQGITLIDTPGVLSGNKQTSRGYDFEGVIQWFAERVDLILLMFDAHKLDISDEFRRCIQALRGNDTKIRILLNKADMVSNQQLMRVYGALMWSLGKVIPTPEVARVYLGSFWDHPLQNDENRRLFEMEANDLYSDISKLPRNAAVRKVNDFIKRARLAKVHACICSYMKKQLPMFGRSGKQKQLIESMQDVCNAVASEYQIPLGDFPSIELLKEKFAQQADFNKFPKLDSKRLESIDDMLTRHIPSLMRLIPGEETEAAVAEKAEGLVVTAQASPFIALKGEVHPQGWAEKKYLVNPPDVNLYRADFEGIGPDDYGLITGQQAKPDLVRSRLPSATLHRVWNLADVTRDGALDLYEYSLARHFIQMKLEGFDLPRSLPDELKPPSCHNDLLPNL
eukprot:Selendium_serpulae@DN6357_c0_g1_i1.p1